jgi:hypothetical protein
MSGIREERQEREEREEARREGMEAHLFHHQRGNNHKGSKKYYKLCIWSSINP